MAVLKLQVIQPEGKKWNLGKQRQKRDMLIFHAMCYGIPKLKQIFRNHSLPLDSIQIFSHKHLGIRHLMTNRVSDFLTTFFAGRNKSFAHFAFSKKCKGMETAWYRGHGRGKERLTFSSPINQKVLVHVKSPQLCPTLCNPMDFSLPCSSVHGILQARILEWVAISSSRTRFFFFFF